MSECTAGPPLAPLQPWLWQNSGWVKVPTEMLLIVPKHASESCIGRQEQGTATRSYNTAQWRSAGLDGNWSMFWEHVMSVWLLGSRGRVCELVIFASLGSNAKFALLWLIAYTMWHVYMLIWKCLHACVCVFVCIVHAGEHARMAAVCMHCCKC